MKTYNRIVKGLNWKLVRTLFEQHSYISIRKCFNLFMQYEKFLKLYIISFLCGTTCHVVSIEVSNKLILDTDSGFG